MPTRNPFHPSAVILGGLFGLAAAAAAAPFLVEQGQPRAQIVVAGQPPRMTRLAAEELQAYVEKISGARLPIVTAADNTLPVKIYVGRSPETDRLGVSDEGLKHGAFRMVAGNDYLVLLGRDSDYTPPKPFHAGGPLGETSPAMQEWDKLTGETWEFPLGNLFKEYSPILKIWERDERGSFNAVCAFLHDLGVRWYLPDPLGEIVPRQPTLPLPTVNRTVRPDFALRYPLQYFRLFNFEGATRDEVLWQLRLGLDQATDTAGYMEISLSHGISPVHGRAAVKQAHPDWYIMSGGRRDTEHFRQGRPCLSSEGLFQANLKFARAVFDLYGIPMISAMPQDGYIFCQCDLCKGKNTPERGWNGEVSDYVWGYVNRLAQELYKTHPDRKVSCFAYGTYSLPPLKIEQLSPNILVGLCQHRMSYNDPATFAKAQNLRQAWLAKMAEGHKQLVIWDYYLNAMPRSPYAGVPVLAPHAIAKDLRSLKGLSLGDFIETYRDREPGIRTLAVNHLNLYVTARFLWDAGQDVDALLHEYYRDFYGPAAAAMKEFVDFSEAHWPEMTRNAESIDRALALLAAARASAGDSVHGRRIALLTDYVQPLYALREKLAEGRKGAPTAAAAERKLGDLTLDGKPDEAFWKDVPVYELKDIAGQPATLRTTFQAAWADRNIVFAIRCEEPDMANLLVTTTTRGDANIWNDDNVELMLETPTHSYYQIAINAAGAVVDADRREGINTLWSSEAEVRAHRGDAAWSIEIRIPTADLIEGGLDPLKQLEGRKPTPAEPWYFNVCRQRMRSKEPEWTIFAPPSRPELGFHDLLKYGELHVRE